MFASRLLLAIIVIVGVPAATVAYVWLVERVVALLPNKSQPRVRPWLWVGPALALLTFYLIYPTINTAYLSLLNGDSTKFVGLENYVYFFTNNATLTALRNNVLWLIFFTLLTVTLGLLIAVLFDRVSYEAAAKALIFMPLALSFVAAGVIWKLMYDFQPPGRPQTGTLNAIVTLFGGDPVAWLVNRPTNNPALIWVGVWMWTGFAMVILSAGLKGIPTEILEAGRVDGANEWQILRRITIPMLGSTIAVVATTMVIWALKVFDIVYVMTNGNFGTEVIANRMYKEMFNFRNFGRASAIAIVLLLAIIPVMLVNIRRFREQEAIR
ncbi:MAG: sugar ABC transporter permease [Ardenticatenaceae bacterium]|nr:sugar ABC transporter permease [Ardenticatenaceae bacterium]